MRIDLIGFTHLDWPKYISFCKDTTGDTPTRTLDQTKMVFNEQLSFALSLNELAGRKYEPIKTIRDGNLNLDASSVILIAERIDFEWYGSIKKFDLLNQISLLVGTIREWKDTVVSNMGLTSDYEKNRREFFRIVLGIFEAYEFKLLWENYRRVKLEDGTWCLKEK